MQKGAPVALSIIDPENPYRYIQIRGRVEHVTEAGASAHINSLAKKYLGKDKYPWAQPGQVRITFEIEKRAQQLLWIDAGPVFLELFESPLRCRPRLTSPKTRGRGPRHCIAQGGQTGLK